MIRILRRINLIPRIDTYLFKVHSNIVLPSTPRPPQRYLSSLLLLLHIIHISEYLNQFIWDVSPEVFTAYHQVFIRNNLRSKQSIIFLITPIWVNNGISFTVARRNKSEEWRIILIVTWNLNCELYIEALRGGECISHNIVRVIKRYKTREGKS